MVYFDFGFFMLEFIMFIPNILFIYLFIFFFCEAVSFHSWILTLSAPALFSAKYKSFF